MFPAYLRKDIRPRDNNASRLLGPDSCEVAFGGFRRNLINFFNADQCTVKQNLLDLATCLNRFALVEVRRPMSLEARILKVPSLQSRFRVLA